MSENRDTITVEIIDLTCEDWKMTLPAFLSWVQDSAAKVPEEFRSNISVVAEEHDRGDYYTTTVTVSYTRPETDDEFNKRIANERFWKNNNATHERREYERLKAKYEHGA